MKQEYNYTPLPEPILITEQVWPEGTLPLVCTSTLAYNHESYIRECLDGILMQKTTFPVQVLVHEDCSTDRTAEILKEYQTKYPNLIKVFYQPENVYSLKDQEEKRKRRAEFNSWRTGKYVATCEGDDYWTDPLKLQKQVEFLEANPEYSMCFHNAEILYQNTIKRSQKINFNIKKTKEFNSSEVLLNWTVPTASIVCLYDAIKNIKYSANFLYGDIVIILTCLDYGKCWGINEKMSVYRRCDTGALLSNVYDVSHYDSLLRHYNEIKKVFKKVSPFTIKHLKSRIEILKVYSYIKSKKYSLALNQIVHTLIKYNFILFVSFPKLLLSKLKSIRYYYE